MTYFVTFPTKHLHKHIMRWCTLKLRWLSVQYLFICIFSFQQQIFLQMMRLGYFDDSLLHLTLSMTNYVIIINFLGLRWNHPNYGDSSPIYFLFPIYFLMYFANSFLLLNPPSKSLKLFKQLYSVKWNYIIFHIIFTSLRIWTNISQNVAEI